MRNIVEFDVMAQDFHCNPYPAFERLHANNQVFRDSEFNAYFFGHYEDVSHILQSSDFTTEPLAKRAEPVTGGRVLAQMEGKEHHSKRRAVLSGLSGKLFREKYAAIIETITLQLLEAHMACGRIDLIKDFGRSYSVLVSLNMLGLPVDRHQEVAIWHRGITHFITSLKLSEEERKHSLRCSQNLIGYLTPIIEDASFHADGSLISMLCRAENNGEKMTTSEIVALVINVLLAATEPADKALASLFYHLLHNPHCIEKVRSDRTLLNAAIGETLRLTSPVQLIPRQASKDLTLAGIELPKDTLIFCMTGAANRDPSVFKDPSRFILDRRQQAKNLPDSGKIMNHLAFGTGAHACVGTAFSLMQIELTANLLLDRLENLRLAEGYSLQEEGLYVRGPATMCLEFAPQNGLSHSSEATRGESL
ncbi:cytochrome P450, cyclodipeptide synthase-associated [Winslowiella iniecta]|uniref:Cytochrome P450 n=1 Tax=Winslowiella iniecta TaxID=1560201 RepID=A0A0L7T4F2_9GAMM|nr:cytochrome P450, cyclodipeptide synthase-associated [Winslowiella iniecta]KOC87860.1 cytochrome P450 [Winslowiella iniecta]KOC90228.1 cytochrome P450 [Winslowiella iniecta]